MTPPDDGPWDDATQHDDSAQMDGDDQPTMRANDDHVAALRKERMKQRLIDDAASNVRRRTTNQGLQDRTRTPAQGNPTTPPHGVSTAQLDMHVSRTVTDRGIPVQPDPSSTNRGIPVAPRGPMTASPDLASTSSPDIASALYAAAGDVEIDPSSTARGMPAQGRTPAIAKGRHPTEDGVILLDRVSGNAPTDDAPRRSESASGGVVVVATGSEADRVRRLCHTHSLLVPVMSSLAIAHEALYVIVIGEPSPPAPERVAHVVRPSVTDRQLVDLIRSLVSGRVVAALPEASAEVDPRVLDAAQRIAKLDDRAAIESIMVDTITAVVGADRAHCLYFDPLSGGLWSEGARVTLGDSRRAIAGFVGWAAYTGEALHAEPAGDDPRYLQELDDPEGKAQTRLIVQPIIGGDRRTHAVLVAVRRWRHDPFKPSHAAALASLAALVAPTLDLVAPAPPVADGRKPRTTIPGALKNAQTAALIAPPRTKPPTGPSPLTAPRPRPPSAPGMKRPPTSPPTRDSSAGIDGGRSSSSSIDAPTAPRAPIVDEPADASDSKRLRTTSQPPSTSTTGRTRAPTGESRPNALTPATASPTASRPRNPTDETRPEMPSGGAPRSPTPPGGSSRASTPGGGSPSSARPRNPTDETRPEMAPGSSRPPTGPNPIAAHRPGTGPNPIAGHRPPTGPNPITGKRPPTGPNPVTGHRPGSGQSAGAPSTGPIPRPSAPLVEKLPLPAPRHPPSSPPAPSATIAMAHRVAIVAGDEEHDRARRIAKTCGLEIALASTTESAPADARLVTLGLPWSPDIDPRVVYVARTTMSNDHLADLLTAVATGKALSSNESLGKANNPTEARRAQIAFTGSRAFAGAVDFVSAETTAVSTLRELLDADRAYFLLYDDASGALSSPGRKLSMGDNRRSIAGLAGWVAHTGRAALAERAASDPRWLGPIDDPDGDSNSQLLMQPVLRSDQHVQAIIVAARRPRRPGFTDIDAALAERFASLVAPLLQQLHQHVENQKLIGDPTGAGSGDTKPAPAPTSPLKSLLLRIKKLFGA
ncbi:MAG TPA: GAF domain-containing protein [Kofleriaceae bacterium]|nr:GAF domain-containing protein [Kofleriaceae bacterium]